MGIVAFVLLVLFAHGHFASLVCLRKLLYSPSGQDPPHIHYVNLAGESNLGSVLVWRPLEHLDPMVDSIAPPLEAVASHFARGPRAMMVHGLAELGGLDSCHHGCLKLEIPQQRTKVPPAKNTFVFQS